MMAAFIAALDVGTTSVRCFILNEKCTVQSSAVETVELLNPKPGYFEIEPEALWRKIIKVIRDALKAAQLLAKQLTCLTISTQRCTFLTWNHRTNDYYHNFITWKDLRANTLVEQWNASCTLKAVNAFSYALYLITRSNRFLAGSVLKMMNGQVTMRLLHELKYNMRLQRAIKAKQARVELLDSWLLYKLRSGNGLEPSVEHITDVTSCTATGLFDPFILSWSPLIRLVFGIDMNLLPKIVDNAYKHFGVVHSACFGAEIPIAISVSDQTAAIWGSQCFQEGEVKITMGTGAFLNLITGENCQASLMGMYPLVAWQFQHNNNKSPHTVFCIEGASHDFGTIITWAKSCGLIHEPAETAAIAESIADTNDVYFMPAFSGFGPPVNDHKAASGFIGMSPSTTRAHMVRALLESIVYRLVQLCETVKIETNLQLRLLKVDGGVSRNNFVCQFLADATGISVERAEYAESSIMGATYLAGINYGIWPSIAHIKDFRVMDRLFVPSPEKRESIRKRYEKWNKAIDRFSAWY